MERIVRMYCLLLALIGVQAMAQTETLKVWGHDVVMTADGETATHLTISEKDVVNYTAFNMTIVVPEGVSIAHVKSGRLYVSDIQINPDRDSGGHTISCNMPDKTTIKIIAYSSDLYEFYPDDIEGNPVDELFTIGLVAAPTMLNGDYDIRIVDCKFTLAEGESSIPQSAIQFKMTVQGGVEGEIIDYTMSEAGFGTLILPFDAEIPDGLKAYECTHVVDGVVQTNELMTISANTPILVSGKAGSYKFVGIPQSNEDSYSAGVLTGVLKEMTITEGYVLQEQNNIIGFYPVVSTKPISVPQYHCYLTYKESLKAIKIGDVLTDINRIGYTIDEEGSIYDMQGKRVRTPQIPGVYIKDNRKVIVK